MSNATWKDQTLTATFQQPFDLLAVTNIAWQKEKDAGGDSSDLRPIWLSTVDILRNLFYEFPTVSREQVNGILELSKERLLESEVAA